MIFAAFIPVPSTVTSAPEMSPLRSTSAPFELISSAPSAVMLPPCASSTPTASITTFPVSIVPFKVVFSVYEFIVSAFCEVTLPKVTP